jgi:hypothetical protein
VQSTDEATLRLELFEPVRVYWRRILVGAFVAAIAILAYKLISPPRYTTTVIVYPAARTDAQNSGSSALAGLSGLAGINIGGDRSNDFDQFMYLLSSPELAQRLITNGHVLSLYYPKWHPERGTWDAPEGFIETLGSYMRSGGPDQYTVSELLGKHITIRKIPSPDTARLSTNIYAVEYTDVAKDRAVIMLRDVIANANEIVRSQAANHAEKQSRYLENKLKTTDTEEYRQTLLRLFSQQQQTLMLANSDVPYAGEILGEKIPRPRRVPKQTVITTLVGISLTLSLGYFLAILVFNLRRGKPA